MSKALGAFVIVATFGAACGGSSSSSTTPPTTGGASTAIRTGGSGHSDSGMATGGLPNSGFGGAQATGGVLGSGGAGGSIRLDAGTDSPGSGGRTDAGNLGGSGGALDAGRDLARDMSPADTAGNSTSDGGTSPDSAGGGGTAVTLDSCFADLRKLSSPFQIATKVSADGKTRVRIALEWPPGFGGTSGTYPWRFIRFGMERDQTRVCITEAAQLKYLGSHHNCSDSATATEGDKTYTLTSPDREFSTVVIDGVKIGLSNTTCQAPPNQTCRSGGPC